MDSENINQNNEIDTNSTSTQFVLPQNDLNTTTKSHTRKIIIILFICFVLLVIFGGIIYYFGSKYYAYYQKVTSDYNKSAEGTKKTEDNPTKQSDYGIQYGTGTGMTEKQKTAVSRPVASNHNITIVTNGSPPTNSALNGWPMTTTFDGITMTISKNSGPPGTVVTITLSGMPTPSDSDYMCNMVQYRANDLSLPRESQIYIQRSQIVNGSTSVNLTIPAAKNGPGYIEVHYGKNGGCYGYMYDGASWKLVLPFMMN